MNKMLRTKVFTDLNIVLAIGFFTSFLLYAYSVVLNHGFYFSFLVFNLFLALIPLIVSSRLVYVLKRKRWSAWESLATTLIWIIFLPNSFYMISDYIHLQYISSSTILYNVILFSSFIYLAVFMGLVSLYQVHSELRSRVKPKAAAVLVAAIIFGCCFAIYLGRDLRWNSWDIVVHPAGLLFDISNLILKPQTYPSMVRTMLSFFVALGSAYLITWHASRLLWHKGVKDLAAHMRRKQDY